MHVKFRAYVCQDIWDENGKQRLILESSSVYASAVLEHKKRGCFGWNVGGCAIVIYCALYLMKQLGTEEDCMENKRRVME